MNETKLGNVEPNSDYWMISNFPTRLQFPSGKIADFQMSIIFHRFSANGERLQVSPEYLVVAEGVRSLDEAVSKIKVQAAEMLRRDFPNAIIF